MASLESTTSLRKVQTEKVTKLMISSHHLSNHKTQLTLKMTIHLDQSKKTSQLTILHVNGLVKFKSNNKENTLSSPNLMTDLNYGSTATNS